MMLERSGLLAPLKRRLDDGLAVLGTCAGMILLAREILDGRDDQHCLAAVDIVVRRNAYGTQIESFEADIEIDRVRIAVPRRVHSRPRWWRPPARPWRYLPVTVTSLCCAAKARSRWPPFIPNSPTMPASTPSSWPGWLESGDRAGALGLMWMRGGVQGLDDRHLEGEDLDGAGPKAGQQMRDGGLRPPSTASCSLRA